MAKVVWTRPARKDLHEIVEYIARDSRFYAERMRVRLVRAPRLLSRFPLSGRIVPEFNDEMIREVIYGNYRIIYVRGKQKCFIVAVIHLSRDLIRLLKPGEWDLTDYETE